MNRRVKKKKTFFMFNALKKAHLLGKLIEDYPDKNLWNDYVQHLKCAYFAAAICECQFGKTPIEVKWRILFCRTILLCFSSTFFFFPFLFFMFYRHYFRSNDFLRVVFTSFLTFWLFSKKGICTSEVKISLSQRFFM